MNREDLNDLKKLIVLLVELYKKIHLNDSNLNSHLTMVVELQMNNLLSIAEMIDSETFEILYKVGFDLNEAIGKPLNDLYAKTIEALYK